MKIDVKYLDIKWSDENTVLKIDSSQNSLTIEQHNGYSQVESTTFKNYLPRLGFRILDKETLHPPCFIISDTKTKDLLPVVDPTTHETWWIESSGWDNKRKYHLSELYRTVGSVSVKVQNKILKIVNNSIGFTVDELEAYLRDFKNDLWMLILNEQGYIKGAIEKELPSAFHPEMVNYLQEYADAIERITKKPTNELKEVQVARPVRLVKPVNRTFMELAVKGNPKHLTSRAREESYDTPDNRYIHYTLKRVLYLINQLAVLGTSQDSIYERIISAEQGRLDALSDFKQIDPVVFHNEIKSINEKLKDLRLTLDQAVTESPSQGSGDEYTYRFRLSKRLDDQGEDENKFFCSVLDGDSFREKYNNASLIVEFPDGLRIDGIDSKSLGIEILVRGNAIRTRWRNNNGFTIRFTTILDFVLEDHPLFGELVRLEERKASLARVDWIVPYTDQEMKDVDYERKFLHKKLELLNSKKKSINGFNIKISPILRALRDSKLFFEKNSVGISANFPNSMVFVQNPSYSLAKSTFSQISNVNGMDESIFKAMMTIDEIGLVNISNLYEKWCLLQIIKVLTNIYSFSISENWQHELIEAVSSSKYNLKFKMMSATLGRSIFLTYEHEFEPGNPNSRRPDYVIDVLDSSGQIDKRYVLDAKFKDTLDDSSLADLITELYSVKDYSEGEKNKVFILHASNSAIKNRVSPLYWGGNSDYGQTHRHRYGGVYLSPSHKHGRSIDNLQRLIGMFLQESNDYGETEMEIDHRNPFCMACGNSDKSRLKITAEGTKSGATKWNVWCSNCNHLQVRSFCRACRYPLNKNGYYWTYHRTRAEQPFNIVCPNCEEFL
jgi:predicted component of viral defense system (DUF524 family)